jgi:hypothetical protein
VLEGENADLCIETLQLAMAVTIVLYFPTLVPHTGYSIISSEVSTSSADYEALPAEEQVFPEFKSSIFSSKLETGVAFLS